jgi:hypothetical protein
MVRELEEGKREKNSKKELGGRKESGKEKNGEERAYK